MPIMREFEHYTILGQIAEGGMGIVYQAVHRGLNRSCALKVIRSGLLASDDERRRFVTEAEAVAKLDHPHIIRVSRAAEFDGQWFLEMELIEGGTLADRVAEGALQSIEGARVVERLSRAVQHAHDRGILHRDLKPANVLLTPGGEPKLVDFGLARFLEDDRDLTRTVAVLGTPAYLAPEIASGRACEATTASDVYSLGVILFECLTGQRPFRGDSALDILRAIREDATPSPGSLRAGIPADLEVIAMRCLAKEPDRRFHTAGELADELSLFLNDEPIRSRAVTPLESAWLWSRRKPAVATLTAAVLFVALLGVVGVLIQFRRAERSSHEARQNLDTALRAMRDLGTMAMDERLQDPGIDDLRQRLFGTLMPFFEKFVGQNPDDLVLAAEQARASRSLSSLLQTTGDHQAAEQEFVRAINLQSNLATLQPDVGVHRRDLAAVHAEYALLLSEMARHREAVASAETGVAILEQHARTVSKPSDYRPDFGRAYYTLGFVLVRFGERAEAAERALREAVRIRQELAATDPRPATRNDLGIALLNLGNHISNQQRRSETEVLWTNAARVFTALAAEVPGVAQYQQRLASTHDRLARLYADTQRWEQAEDSFQKGRSALENLAANYPRRPVYRVLLADSSYQMGTRGSFAGRTNQAAENLHRAVDLSERLVADHSANLRYHSSLTSHHLSLGQHYERVGNSAKAEDCYRRALQTADVLVRVQSGSLSYQELQGRVHRHLGLLLMTQPSRFLEAQESMMRAIRIQENRIRITNNNVRIHWELAADLARMGGWHLDANRFEASERMCRQSIAVLQGLPEAEQRSEKWEELLAQDLFNLAVALDQERRPIEALEAFRKAEPLLRACIGRHRDEPSYGRRLAQTLEQIQRLEQRHTSPRPRRRRRRQHTFAVTFC